MKTECESLWSYLTAAEVHGHVLQIQITGQAEQKSSKTMLLKEK